MAQTTPTEVKYYTGNNPNPIETVRCHRCGIQCIDGGEIRYFDCDPETGYVDDETICNSCLDEEERSKRWNAFDEAEAQRD